ncbi:PID-CTERM protein-sorting domain-containing protein [Hymenobacter bucti]|uniref:PID-CTERM protein-sorting domain-containing protein n=1 Tax=Hymenobacter bucti TaxID=1844114 RepID=A0ABW4QVE5_9BACT
MLKISSCLRLLAVAGLLLSASSAYAQPGSGGTAPDPTPDPTAVPLDGGASLIAAAGIGFGIRKLRARFRRS